MEGEPKLESNEVVEQGIFERLNSLGINYKYGKKFLYGKPEYKFFNVENAGPGAFWLDASGKKIVFQTFHFDDGKIKNLVDGKETTAENFIAMIKELFPEAEEFVFSCCYPDDARTAFQGISNEPIIIGSGISEYKTVHNSYNNSITVSMA